MVPANHISNDTINKTGATDSQHRKQGSDSQQVHPDSSAIRETLLPDYNTDNIDSLGPTAAVVMMAADMSHTAGDDEEATQDMYCSPSSDDMASAIEGQRSLAMRIRALQLELLDKTLHITTLEMHLRQARRKNHSLENEINKLRAQSSDHIRVVNTLRNAVRHRDMLDKRKSDAVVSKAGFREASVSDIIPDDHSLGLIGGRECTDSSCTSARGLPVGIGDGTGCGSSSSHMADTPPDSSPITDIATFSTPHLTPLALLSPTGSTHLDKNSKSSQCNTFCRKSMNEKITLLDKMIELKVESGISMREKHKSPRSGRLTVMKDNRHFVAQDGWNSSIAEVDEVECSED